MKNSTACQKGVAPIIIVLTIVGILVAAGIWYWQGQEKLKKLEKESLQETEQKTERRQEPTATEKSTTTKSSKDETADLIVVAFSDLISNHKSYNNKEVCVRGEYFSNFETAQLRPSGYAKSNENVIFIDINRSLEKEKLNCDSSSRNCELSVLVCGIYESKIGEHTDTVSYYGGVSCPNCNSKIKVKDIRKFDCPQWTPPAPDWCSDDKIIQRGNDKYGCPQPPRCERN